MRFLIALWLPALVCAALTMVFALVNPKSPVAAVTMLLAFIGIGIANRCSKIYLRTRIRARAWQDARKRR